MPRYDRVGEQISGDDNKPLINGKLKFEISGGGADLDTFSDPNLKFQNTNPVLLSASGRVPNIWFNGEARVILTADNLVQIEVKDPIPGTASAGQSFEDWNVAIIYNINEIVKGTDENFYKSIDNGNIGNDPVLTTGFWMETLFTDVFNIAYTYKLGQLAIASDNIVYRSRVSTNIGNNPITDATNWARNDFILGADVASATTLLIDIPGNQHNVTGTVDITEFAATNGAVPGRKLLRFADILTLTDSVDLDLGGEDIITAVGDLGDFYEYATGDWRLIQYYKVAFSTPTGLTPGTPVAASGTLETILNIPVGVNRVTVDLVDFNANSGSSPIVQIGSSSGLKIVDYLGTTSRATGAAPSNYTNGFIISSNNGASNILQGRITLVRQDPSNNVWTSSTSIGRSDNTEVFTGGGSNSLPGSLDRIGVTTEDGTTTISGSINITFE